MNPPGAAGHRRADPVDSVCDFVDAGAGLELFVIVMTLLFGPQRAPLQRVCNEIVRRYTSSCGSAKSHAMLL